MACRPPFEPCVHLSPYLPERRCSALRYLALPEGGSSGSRVGPVHAVDQGGRGSVRNADGADNETEFKTRGTLNEHLSRLLGRSVNLVETSPRSWRTARAERLAYSVCEHDINLPSQGSHSSGEKHGRTATGTNLEFPEPARFDEQTDELLRDAVPNFVIISK
ncbi:hypothetical protein Bbelb_095990 [Branchiostoma belcheri]|nr:hypothetical protein Bbelb_095990 [Branchiostoma belcheri]